MGYGRRDIVQFGPDDFGVYISRTRGPLGTSLQFRGTWDQVTNLNVEVKFSGGCFVELYDRASGEYRPVPVAERGLGVV